MKGSQVVDDEPRIPGTRKSVSYGNTVALVLVAVSNFSVVRGTLHFTEIGCSWISNGARGKVDAQ